MYRAVTDRFPSVSTVRVKDAIAQVNGLLQQLSDGVRAASLVTILAGSPGAGRRHRRRQRARLYDSTVMKVLGATRRADRGDLCRRIWADRAGDRAASRWRPERLAAGSSPSRFSLCRSISTSARS